MVGVRNSYPVKYIKKTGREDIGLKVLENMPAEGMLRFQATKEEETAEIEKFNRQREANPRIYAEAIRGLEQFAGQKEVSIDFYQEIIFHYIQLHDRIVLRPQLIEIRDILTESVKDNRVQRIAFKVHDGANDEDKLYIFENFDVLDAYIESVDEKMLKRSFIKNPLDKAIYYCKNLLENYPKNLRIYKKLAEIYLFKLHDENKGMEVIRDIRQKFGDNPEALFLMGDILLFMDVNKAVKVFENAKIIAYAKQEDSTIRELIPKIDSHLIQAHLSIGQSTENYDEIFMIENTLHELSKNDSEVCEYIATTHLVAGNYDRSVFYYERIYNQNPFDVDIVLGYTKALILRNNIGDIIKAEQIINHCILKHEKLLKDSRDCYDMNAEIIELQQLEELEEIRDEVLRAKRKEKMKSATNLIQTIANK